MSNHATWGIFRHFLRVLGRASTEDGAVADAPPKPVFEPVHGWTTRERDAYLARNPGYRASYEADLQKCMAFKQWGG